MKERELTILFNEDRPSEECKNFVANLLTEKDYKYEDEGVRRLAYPVQGNERARYVYVTDLHLTDKEAQEIDETLYNLYDYRCGVFRHLLVTIEKKGEE